MSAGGNGIVITRTKGYFTVHGIPYYSEHSNFDELVDCLDALKPKRIIPTISVSKSGASGVSFAQIESKARPVVLRMSC
jgi:hypothetical protein